MTNTSSGKNNNKRSEQSEDGVTLEEQSVPLAAAPAVELADEEIPLAAAPVVELADEEVPMAELVDEEVPLAMLPATGDAMSLWAVLSGISMAGAIVLTKRGKED